MLSEDLQASTEEHTKWSTHVQMYQHLKQTNKQTPQKTKPNLHHKIIPVSLTNIFFFFF